MVEQVMKNKWKYQLEKIKIIGEEYVYKTLPFAFTLGISDKWMDKFDNEKPIIATEIGEDAKLTITATDETAIKNLNRTLDLLDESDDVQNVYHN